MWKIAVVTVEGKETALRECLKLNGWFVAPSGLPSFIFHLFDLEMTD